VREPLSSRREEKKKGGGGIHSGGGLLVEALRKLRGKGRDSFELRVGNGLTWRKARRESGTSLKCRSTIDSLPSRKGRNVA